MVRGEGELWYAEREAGMLRESLCYAMLCYAMLCYDLRAMSYGMRGEGGETGLEQC